MTTTFNNILLWMFVINLGVTFGAGLYEQRIVVPLWFIGFERRMAGRC